MNAAGQTRINAGSTPPPAMTWTPEGYMQVCQRWLRHKALVAARPLCRSSSQQRELANAPEGRHARYIPCPLCGSDAYRIFHAQTVKGYTVVQCSACGFLYRNPTYRPTALTDAYNQGYLAFLEGAYSQDRRALYRRVLDELEFSRQTAGYDRRRLLDVGCGHGLFLTVARELGWEPYGLDFAADCIQHARTAFGLPNAAVGNLTPASFEPGFFDAVTLWSVAAHLDDPVGMFKNIHRVLRPGGILIIYTVNAESLGHRRRLADWGGFHKNHLVFFTADSLAGALRQTGFGDVQTAPEDRQLEAAMAAGSLSGEHQPYFRDLFARHNLGMLMVSACSLACKKSEHTRRSPAASRAANATSWTKSAYQQAAQQWQRHTQQVSESAVLSAVSLQQHLAATPAGAEFMYIPCPLCHHDHFRVYYPNTAAGYPAVQCARCDFLYRNPTYRPQKKEDVYNQGYLDFLSGTYSRNRLHKYRRVLDELEFSRQTAGYDRRRLLDVGCGYGLFLTAARELGWEPYGLDFAADCIQHARTAFGLPNAAVGNLTPASFEPGFFDAVTLWSVAAHLDDPVGMFKNIHRVLRPGGILIIYTVDAGGFMHWLEREKWKGFHGNHLVFFTPQTLQKTLAEAGFCCKRIAYDNRFMEKAVRMGRVSADDEAFFRHTAPSHNLGYMLKAAFSRTAD